jgi:hypothetical protein
MILCEDWGFDPSVPRRINVYGLLSNIKALDEPAYPLVYRELCVLLLLTEVRGSGLAQILCVLQETGQPIFATRRQAIAFPNDPLKVVTLPFRIRDCRFPRPGLYSVQFWYNRRVVDERPLLLR